MTSTQHKKLWSWLGPIAIFVSGFYLPLPPLLCNLFIQIGNFYTAILGLVLSSGLYMLLFGKFAFPFILFFFVTTIGVYALTKKETTPINGLVFGALTGLVGAVAALALFTFIAGSSPAAFLTEKLEGMYLNSAAESGERFLFDYFLLIIRAASEGLVNVSEMEKMFSAIGTEDIAEKAKEFSSVVRVSLQVGIPSMLIRFGLISGGAGWYLAAYFASRKETETRKAWQTPIPSISKCILPAYLTLSIGALWLIAWGLSNFETEFLQYSEAIAAVAKAVFIFQGVGLTCAFLERKKTHPALQVVLVLLVLVLLSGLFIWLGVFDTVFKMRKWMSSLDYLKERGIDPSSPEAIDVLQKHEEELKRAEQDKNKRKD